MDSKATAQLGENRMVSWSGHPEDLLGPLSRAERNAAPSILYGRGRRELLATAPRVAVVGSRRASGDGLARASEIAEELVDAGVVVVSGLALGIDTVAHQTAIDCGGSTIAVLATGLEQYATSRNRKLQDKIGTDHLLLSQFSGGTTVHRSHFPRRNKIMALVADATIIVEAQEKSGTIHQGWEAIRLGKPVLFPEFFATKAPTWTKEMIDYGATVLGSKTLELVMDELPYRSTESFAF